MKYLIHKPPCITKDDSDPECCFPESPNAETKQQPNLLMQKLRTETTALMPNPMPQFVPYHVVIAL